MGKKKKSSRPPSRIAADNRRARHLYSVEEEFEAGIALRGSEIKSLRAGQASLRESYAEERGRELWLVNAHIPEFMNASHFNHEPRRPRKLLMHRKQIDKLAGAVQKGGMTLVPLQIYFNDAGKAKVLLGLAKGKKAHDKREAEKTRDWQRDKARLMKEHS